MKKILVCTVLLAVSMVSCLKETNVKRLPIAGGLEMRTAVFFQNVFALDPAVVAFRLNILLSEAKKQGQPELDRVKITIDDKEHFLMEYLFKMAKSIERKGDDGTYSIRYSSSEGEALVGDVLRDGTILVQTNNKLIEELEIGDSWNLYSLPTDKKYRLDRDIMIKLPPKEEGGIGGTESYYSIYPTGTPRQWRISTYNLVTYSENREELPGTWQMDFDVTQTGPVEDMSYDGIQKSGFTMTGDAGGIPTMFYNAQMSYVITAPLKYKTTCPNTLVFFSVFEGSEKITLQSATLPIEYFPSDVVTVQWREVTKCKQAHYIRYNGYLMDSQTGTAVEEGIGM